MKKLSKAQRAERDERVKALNDAKLEVDAAVAAANEKIAEANLAVDDVNSKIAYYNEAVAAAAEFRDEIVGEMDGYASERSEKWAEGDAGQNYESWKGEWEGIQLDEVEELEQIEELEELDVSHADELEALPEEPG